jgi:hypothetical protein
MHYLEEPTYGLIHKIGFILDQMAEFEALT